MKKYLFLFIALIWFSATAQNTFNVLAGYSNNGTNFISYANGANFELQGSAKSNITFALVDTNASQYAVGAINGKISWP